MLAMAPVVEEGGVVVGEGAAVPLGGWLPSPIVGLEVSVHSAESVPPPHAQHAWFAVMPWFG